MIDIYCIYASGSLVLCGLLDMLGDCGNFSVGDACEEKAAQPMKPSCLEKKFNPVVKSHSIS